MKTINGLLHAGIALVAITAIVLPGCHKKDSSPDTAPVITSFSPGEAAPGTTVILKGRNFSGDKTSNLVKFNGAGAAVIDATPAELAVIIPEDASTGKITVTIGDKTAVSATAFKVNAAAPTINGFSPEKGDVDVLVTIKGQRFTDNSKVYFGGVEATTVNFAGKTSLTARVPAGASTGKIKVVTKDNLEALSTTDFWVKPTITAFTPEKQEEGKKITITGSNFSAVATDNKVFFGTVAATDVTVMSATQLQVVVPAGAANDKVHVVVKEQEAVSAASFLMLPTLTSFSPVHGERRSVVTLKGKNFATGAEIYFNGIKITVFESRSATDIQFRIPNDAVDGTIKIKQDGAEYEFTGAFAVTNYWAVINNPFSFAARANAIAHPVGNKLYYGLGNGKRDFYQISLDNWSVTSLPDYPGGNVIPGASYEYNGDIYVFGGYTSTNPKACYKFKTASNEWVLLPDYPGTGDFVRGIAFRNADNTLTVGAGKTTGTLYYFDLATNSWLSKTTAFPVALEYAIVGQTSSGVYVGTGHEQNSSGGGGSYHSSIWKLSSDGTWLGHGAYPNWGGGYTAAVVSDHLFAGGDGTNTFTTTGTEWYCQNATEWKRIADMPVAQHLLKSFAYNGKLYALGGYGYRNGGLPNKDVYIYIPRKDFAY